MAAQETPARAGSRPIAVLLAIGAIAVGCGEDEAETPAACFSGTGEYLAALEAAPSEVRLGGETPISDCLPSEQEGAELGDVGQAAIAAATDLNEEARRDPTGPESLRLGYLVGAVERGAEDIHADLVRRLNNAARFTPSGELLPASFERTFGRGYAAGLDSG
jgi:hypothetical protein